MHGFSVSGWFGLDWLLLRPPAVFGPANHFVRQQLFNFLGHGNLSNVTFFPQAKLLWRKFPRTVNYESTGRYCIVGIV